MYGAMLPLVLPQEPKAKKEAIIPLTKKLVKVAWNLPQAAKAGN